MQKKFIRTKDRIYELVDDKYIIQNNKLYEKEYFNNPFGDGSDEYIGEVLIGEILAQADTIKELCDCFVAVRKNASGTYSVFFIDFEDWETWISGYVIYGAIYTDKGLIYVAKMNEKGELELI